MFQINEVISVDGVAYRILAELPDEIILIALDNESAFPSVVSRQELLDAIDNEVLQRIEDPYATGRDRTLLMKFEQAERL